MFSLRLLQFDPVPVLMLSAGFLLSAIMILSY
jgi:hypothetical protein